MATYDVYSTAEPLPFTGTIRDFTTIETIYKRTIRTVVLRIKRDIVAEGEELMNVVDTPGEAYEILKAIFQTLDDDQEHFVLLVLNVANDVTGFKLISSGAQDSTVADSKIVFRNALFLGARSIIVAHNHPSGNPRPSSHDISTTRQLVLGGQLIDIPVLDHLILVGGSFISIRKIRPDCFE